MVVEKIDVVPTKSARNAIISSVLRAVFNYSQQCLVAVNEGETLLLEHEQDDDCFIEGGMEIYGPSLYHLDGFICILLLKHALNVARKSLQVISVMLKSLCLPVDAIGASLIAGLEYGTEQWNGKWNGTMNLHSSS